MVTCSKILSLNSVFTTSSMGETETFVETFLLCAVCAIAGCASNIGIRNKMNRFSSRIVNGFSMARTWIRLLNIPHLDVVPGARNDGCPASVVPHCRNRSAPLAVRPPVHDRMLNFGATKLFRQTALHQGRKFDIRGKAESDQLRVSEFANAQAQRLRQHRRKPETFFQANHTVLHAQCIDPYAKHPHNGGRRYAYQPSTI